MKILLVHQGAELYGSDRTFIQSVIAYRKEFPAARLDVALPDVEDGGLIDKISGSVNNIYFGDVWVLRKSSPGFLFGLFGVPFWGSVLQAYRTMKEYDVVYINTLVTFNFLVASIFTCTPRKIVHVHEITSKLMSSVFSLILMLGRAKLIFNSLATRKSLIISPWQQSQIIPNGGALRGDISFEHIISKVRSNVDEKFNFLFIGRFNDWKGQNLFIEAISLLSVEQKKIIKVKVIGSVFGGQNNYLDDLIDLVNKYSLTDVVKIEGFRADPSDAYQWADVVVVPSIKPEPFGLVAIEGMSYGKCIIGSNHGGLSEIIISGVTGMLFEPDDKQDLVKVISQLLNEPNQIIEMGQQGLNRFQFYYDERIYMSKLAKA